ncbi:hypothetical protein U732_3649 [Clostridium argentinense CDC 2741]|uniref:Uncharacterized protein n=1 Tax=Clostridium argentinense CDC 2741 TaxID=1418104 RepID=A0A0C1R2X7_9CLOT|nr:hypothetical protein [Clostridium argentinense]ARC86201.1 hypothetical protein RSJ17_17715 [Clostridium argentinense]KIE47882.1 hypothetical protein U732_3649 [Clostridium argentinense CDC 2741]NFF40285.1 hypothetical protein [Clostridium argentinense]NFP50094.1 hypothetical protein [Clostridium argentinense]NFP74639.1 hypothetical protein [Clostridium argentinense]
MLKFKKMACLSALALTVSVFANTYTAFAETNTQDSQIINATIDPNIDNDNTDGIMYGPVTPDDPCNLTSTRIPLSYYSYTYCTVAAGSYKAWRNEVDKLDSLKRRLDSEMGKLNSLKDGRSNDRISAAYNGTKFLISSISGYMSGLALTDLAGIAESALNLASDLSSLSSASSQIKNQAKVVEGIARSVSSAANDVKRLQSNFEYHRDKNGCIRHAPGGN